MMKNANKYTRQFFPVNHPPMRWATKNYLDKPPIWCSVDLRDGNQALITPMSLEEKLEFFKVLVDIGFKEIEVGFPAASETEYEFCRTLIEQNLIPDDVTIQVLTQAREHIIAKTFEALQGVKHAIVHLYNSTSVAQREQVFKKSKEEVLNLAVTGAELCKLYRNRTGICTGSVQCRFGRLAADPGRQGDYQLAGNRFSFHAARLCQSGRVHERQLKVSGKCLCFAPSAQ